MAILVLALALELAQVATVAVHLRRSLVFTAQNPSAVEFAAILSVDRGEWNENRHRIALVVQQPEKAFLGPPKLQGILFSRNSLAVGFPLGINEGGWAWVLRACACRAWGGLGPGAWGGLDYSQLRGVFAVIIWSPLRDHLIF